MEPDEAMEELKRAIAKEQADIQNAVEKAQARLAEEIRKKQEGK